MARYSKLQKNLTESHIYHCTVALLSIMLRSLRPICIAILCNYYFQFHLKVTINYHWLNQFLIKSIYNHLISINIAVRIVFQFRKRCTLPTCAMGHRALYCYRRFSAGRLSSACSVYAVCTASGIIFGKNRVSLEHFFFICCKKILSQVDGRPPVLTATSQSNGNGQSLTTHRIQTP